MATGLFQDFNPLQRIAANQHNVSTRSIGRGSLISFHYPQSFASIPNVIHDPYPLVIITDIWPQYIRGVNLHYLTFPYIKRLLTGYGSSGFSYFQIKADRYLANAFRMYVRIGVRQPKRLDSEWLTSVLANVRSFAPGEVEKIRANIQKQIQQRLQAKANELTSYEQWRSQLNESQKRQLRQKVADIGNAVTGGLQRDLIYPNKSSSQQSVEEANNIEPNT